MGNIKAEDFKISMKDLAKFKEMGDIIMVAHYYKDKEMCLEDIEYLESLVVPNGRVFKEPSDLTTLGILNCHGHRAIIGSDVKKWDEYEKSRFGELKFNVKGYENFIKLVDKDVQLIKDSINKYYVEEIEVYGDAENKEHGFPFPIFEDVNVIFGDKGCGKSEILKSLNNYYQEKGEKPVYYTGGDKDKWFEALLMFNKDDYNVADLFEKDISKSLVEIINFTDYEGTKLKDYRDYFAEKRKNKNQQRMLIKDLSKLHTSNLDKYELFKVQYDSLNKFVGEIENFEVVNRNKALYQNMEPFLNQLLNESYSLVLDEWIQQQSSRLVDDVVDKMNRYIAENTGYSVQPMETGFGKFVKERLGLMKNIEAINNFLKKEKTLNPNYIGSVGDKGEDYVVEKIYFINEENASSVNSKKMVNKNITKMRKIIQSLSNVTSSINLNSVGAQVTKLKNECAEYEVKSLSDFLVVEKRFELEGLDYKPSKGEKSILALQYDLLSKSDQSIFLIDEPELSLGSIYINKHIVPLINNLARSRKVVVVATHDGNIAVRTRPLSTVFKSTYNNTYNTYVGNMFTDELVNIEDKTDILSWKKESVKYLEGGESAFEERGYLYD